MSENRCICPELGATGPGQFHTRCPYCAPRKATRKQALAHRIRTKVRIRRR